MQVGDLVVMPGAVEYTTLRQDLGVGLVIDDRPVRNRIGVLWAGETSVDFEPTKWLRVIND